MTKQLFSGSNIKIIATTAMLMDHFGKIILLNSYVMTARYDYFTDKQFSVLLSLVELCNIVGRLALPLFCFLLVEGFCHTRNWQKYGITLVVFGIITEFIYDWSLTGQLVNWQGQNVLFTLAIGLVTLALIKRGNDRVWLAIIFSSIAAAITYYLHLDGWYYAIFLITSFYLFKDSLWKKGLSIPIIAYVCGLDYSFQALIDPSFLMASASFIIIALYNNSRGINMKYFFYWFYPAHLLILKVVSDRLINFL